jgi:putative toxin-antitoxin system antitoxin component (TIGR02293 family)
MGGSIASILGLPARVRTPAETAELAHAGLAAAVLDRLKELYAMTDLQLAQSLDISIKTVQRHRQREGRLAPALSDRVHRLARAFTQASQVLGGDGAARDWLRRPQLGLGQRVPLELLATEAGARDVEDLLGRLEYGVLA